MKITAAEGDANGLPHLTKELASHIADQYQTEGIHALVKSLDYGDGAAKELAEFFVKALRSYEGNNMTLQLQASFRLRATEEPIDSVDVDDVRTVDQGKDPAAFYAAPVEANDTVDFESLPVSDPSQMTKEKADAMETNAAFFTKAEARAAFAKFKADEEKKAGRALTMAELQAIAADEVSDGEAFETLVTPDAQESEPLIQELTHNDGGTEEPSDQLLLRDDLPVSGPTV